MFILLYDAFSQLRWDGMGCADNSMYFNRDVHTSSYQRSPSHTIPSQRVIELVAWTVTIIMVCHWLNEVDCHYSEIEKFMSIYIYLHYLHDLNGTESTVDGLCSFGRPVAHHTVCLNKGRIPRCRHLLRLARHAYILTSDTRDFLKLFLRQAERHADILATILARMLARMSVSASWNAGLTEQTKRTKHSLKTDNRLTQVQRVHIYRRRKKIDICCFFTPDTDSPPY